MTEPWHATLSWDTKVWYVSETNFCGLVAEACTAPALVTKLERLVPKLFEIDLRLLEDCISRTIDCARPNTAQQDL